jgi:phosphomannomutase/phosphoglucomutase
MAINSHIFREYDIRGIVERDLNGDVPRQIGLALGTELRARLGKKAGDRLTIVVGGDRKVIEPGIRALNPGEIITRDIRDVLGAPPTP